MQHCSNHYSGRVRHCPCPSHYAQGDQSPLGPTFCWHRSRDGVPVIHSSCSHGTRKHTWHVWEMRLRSEGKSGSWVWSCLCAMGLARRRGSVLCRSHAEDVIACKAQSHRRAALSFGEKLTEVGHVAVRDALQSVSWRRERTAFPIPILRQIAIP